jgi:prolyl-tRNA editing enzyme YbaK/EbsC (Cys-tRNA(Pro) deacylase)
LLDVRERGHGSEKTRERGDDVSLETVRAFLADRAPDVAIVELGRDSTTATISADWDVAPAQVAKTLSLRIGERNVLVVACGDSRLTNRKVRSALGGSARMLPPADAAALTGHPVGGVCPMGLAAPLPIYFDLKLKGYDEVVPAAGDPRAALRINPVRLAHLVGAQWVDVCD